MQEKEQKSEEKAGIVWQFAEKLLSLQRQSEDFAERMTTFMAKMPFRASFYKPSLISELVASLFV
jgi:hypothetical protein